MRLGRLAIPITAIAAVLMLAGAGTAPAAARVLEPGVTAPSPAPMNLSAGPMAMDQPETSVASGPSSESALRVSSDSATPPARTWVPLEGLYPSESPTAASAEEDRPEGAAAVLETDNAPEPPEGPAVQKSAANTMWDIAVDEGGEGSAGGKQEEPGTGAQPVFQATPVTSYDITLSPGANLISLPLIPEERNIEAVLGTILHRVETVWQYDTSGAAPRWRSYAPGAPSDLRVMRDGPGYWVHLKQGGDAVLTVTGREATGPARRVARGWNLVGFTATSPQSPGEYLGGLSGRVGTTMVGYAGGTAVVVLPSAAPPQLMPGRGYWLYLEAAGTIGGAPPATMAVPADQQDMVVLEHESGARIEIPPGATAGALGEDGAEMVTVTIEEVEAPAESILNVGPVFGFSIVSEDGDEVPLREAVKITLPYALPEDKNAADVIMLHWDEGRRRWESAGGSSEEQPPQARGSVGRKSAGGDGGMGKGGRVDEASGTITAEVEHLSDYAVALFLAPVEYLAVSGLGIVGRELFRPGYNAGFKHLISLDGSGSVPIPHAPNITVGEVGFSLILDLDDIVSLPNVWDDIVELVDAELPEVEIRTPQGITEEGIAGYFTYGLNANVALSVQADENPLPFSGGIRFRLPLTEEYGTTGFNNDVSFDASASALTLSVPYLGEVSAVTVNQNGNIDPTDAQLSTCLACTSSLEVKATLADITFNITKGEFNTGFLSEIADRLLDVDDSCAAPGSQCQLPAQKFSDLWIGHLYGSFAKILEDVAEYLGIIAQYTPYEHTSPDPENPLFTVGYINGVERITGGQDVNGDGRGDMVFPAGSAGGIPLQIWTTGDSHENRKYFLELYDLTEGWEIRPDIGKWHESLRPELKKPSEDAVLRVDFETLALSANQTHWLVTAADDAPNSGGGWFRLVHNRPLLGGFEDVKVDDFHVNLVKDRELTDLSVEVAVSHDPVASGETLIYTVTVHNEGPDAADDVELYLSNAVMHGLALTGASTSGSTPPSCSDSAAAAGYGCRLGNLGAGETIVVTLEFELALSLADGETFNTSFAVMSHTEDLALENNSAAAASTVRVAERVVLDALYNATGGRNWSHQRDWLSGEPIGDWYGVTTDGIGRVTALDLYQNHLTGTIPPELAGLPSLKQLHLSGNGLSGEIPGELGVLTQLEQLIASSNRLSGEIPPELGDLGNLTRLHLSDNQLTGGIPAWLGRLSSLERLSLSRNQLTGQIPPELGDLPNLKFLRLQGNQLTGCIPAGLREVPDNDLDELGLEFCVAQDFAHNPAEDYTRLSTNDNPRGIWSDGETMWVVDWSGAKIYAYDLATKVRVPVQDFTTLSDASIYHPVAIWSDKETMWVSYPLFSGFRSKIYAYDLATKARVLSQEFVIGVESPQGIWSDGETMWVADDNDDKLYAYDLGTKARVPDQDFDTLAEAGNDLPSGLWSDGTTMWVADWLDGKIYAYNMETKARAPAHDLNTLRDAGNHAPVGLWSNGTTIWVADPSDSKIYAYDLASKARVQAQDFNTLRDAGNERPSGIWSDRDTMWVSDSMDGKIYAYMMNTKARLPARDFNNLKDGGNAQPSGIWSDGETMWVVDWIDVKIYAYDVDTKARVPAQDFNSLRGASNQNPGGIWSDRETMWVTDYDDAKIYAYDLATKSRVQASEFNTLRTTGNDLPAGIWSNRKTMWVADPRDDQIYAYRMP